MTKCFSFLISLFPYSSFAFPQFQIRWNSDEEEKRKKKKRKKKRERKKKKKGNEIVEKKKVFPFQTVRCVVKGEQREIVCSLHPSWLMVRFVVIIIFYFILLFLILFTLTPTTPITTQTQVC